ncbi:hypothetical protein B0J13DRAFT_625483 [Dactylonectria estremocensis]|uniref:Uncharacterized protein n=1 Tax=Dactylonectria estremocensis TaxID=1079267 RepID=A0A9P9EHR4_9HYPO|nr:hypothetical protein B0J13DRAFT_625483 [Dactylonectria estremocensis]
MDIDEAGIFWLVRITLMGLLFHAALAVFIASTCRVSTRGDRARKGFNYLKAVLGLLTICYLFDMLQYVFAFLIYYASYYFGQLTIVVLGHLSMLTLQVADVFILMTLTSIAAGILIVHSGNLTSLDKVTVIATYVAAAVLIPIAIAIFGLSLHARIEYSFENTTHIYNLATAFRSLIFVAAVLVLVRAAVVKHQTRHDQRVSKVSTLLLAASGVWFVRALYTIIAIATFESLAAGYWKPYYNLIEALFGYTPSFVAMCLIHFIGSKAQNGLWSSPVAQQTPWNQNYNYNGAQPIPQNMVQSYVQAGWQPMQQAYYPPQVQQNAPYQQGPPTQGTFAHPSELSPQQRYSAVGQNDISSTMTPATGNVQK